MRLPVRILKFTRPLASCLRLSRCETLPLLSPGPPTSHVVHTGKWSLTNLFHYRNDLHDWAPREQESGEDCFLSTAINRPPSGRPGSDQREKNKHRSYNQESNSTGFHSTEIGTVKWWCEVISLKLIISQTLSLSFYSCHQTPRPHRDEPGCCTTYRWTVAQSHLHHDGLSRIHQPPSVKKY